MIADELLSSLHRTSIRRTRAHAEINDHRSRIIDLELTIASLDAEEQTARTALASLGLTVGDGQVANTFIAENGTNTEQALR